MTAAEELRPTICQTSQDAQGKESLHPVAPRFDIAKSLAGVFNGVSEGVETDLHVAARLGLCEMIERLFAGKTKHKPKISGFDSSCMSRNFMKRYVEETERCLPERRAITLKQLNSKNHTGATPLWLASSAGHDGAVELLCKHGADLEIGNFKGQTPLFAAAKHNHVNSVKLLLEAGANPNGSDKNISTPLYIAARENFPQVVSLLIKHGVDVNGRFGEKGKELSPANFIGSVPLYMTIVYQNFECFRQLIVGGAEMNAVANDRGFGTSLVTAVLRHHCDVRYLQLIALCGGIRQGDKESIDEAVSIFRDRTFGLASCRRECLEFLDWWNAQPMQLAQICRTCIRHQMGPKRLPQLDLLGLPSRVQNYLELSHIHPISEYFTDV